jgi:hypothetical protein
LLGRLAGEGVTLPGQGGNLFGQGLPLGVQDLAGLGQVSGFGLRGGRVSPRWGR